MCNTPITLRDGQKVACRNCELCIRNRVDDYVGRAMAESQAWKHTHSVTLTYSEDDARSAVLYYPDVQNMLKKLRKVAPVRFMAAGEYGSLNGRAHWHVILFSDHQFFDRLDWRFDWEYWPHGLSYAQRPDFGGLRYALKYAVKDQHDKASSRCFQFSKKPILGHDFVRRMAVDLAETGLPINAPSYSFLGVRSRGGKHREFWLHGVGRDLLISTYVGAFIDRWGRDPPETDFLWRYQQKATRQWVEGEEADAALAANGPPTVDESTGFISFQQSGRRWTLVLSPGWSYEPHAATLNNGISKWPVGGPVNDLLSNLKSRRVSWDNRVELSRLLRDRLESGRG